MTRRGVLLLTTLFIGCLSASCKTAKVGRADMESGIMYAMVYDYGNTPVNGAEVFIDDHKYTESDINGRFFLGINRPGKYTIQVRKTGYEEVKQEFKFDPMNVLYIRLINATQLLELAEGAVDQGNYPYADSLIARALLIEKDRPDALFLRAVNLFLWKKYNEAEAAIRFLLTTGYEDESVRAMLEILRNMERQ
jgi:hypothetical protein